MAPEGTEHLIFVPRKSIINKESSIWPINESVSSMSSRVGTSSGTEPGPLPFLPRQEGHQQRQEPTLAQQWKVLGSRGSSIRSCFVVRSQIELRKLLQRTTVGGGVSGAWSITVWRRGA